MILDQAENGFKKNNLSSAVIPVKTGIQRATPK